MRGPRVLRAVFFAAACWTSIGSAQTVRGVVTDRITQQPLGDALVGLQSAGPATVRQILITVRTDDGGRFSIRAPVPGTYQLLVRRIGARPFTSPLMNLGAAQEVERNVGLDQFTVAEGISLPEVAVRTVTPCRTSKVEAEQVATLWGLVREALAEANAADAGAFRNAPVVRYVRKLDPKSLNVLQEQIQAFDRNDVRNAEFFRSLPADSLSQMGYWVAQQDGATEFYGLDASSLLSEAFVRDHCFRITNESDAIEQRQGLTFEPVPQRNNLRSPPEIRGTIWLATGSFELRLLRFEWTRLPGNARSENLGGEIEFGRVATGPVEVRRWSLRMPQDIIEIQGSGDHVIRVQRLGIVEEGGLVLSAEDTTEVGSAVLSGTVRDSERRPLAGALVRVVGSSAQATTDVQGRYRITGIRRGLAYVVAEHDTYTALGMRVAESRVLLDDKAVRTLSFAALSADSIITRLCGGQNLRNTAVVRLQFVDSTTSQPVPRLIVRLFSSAGQTAYSATSTTDVTGAVLYCGVPALRSLSFEAREGDGLREAGNVDASNRVGARLVRVRGR